MGFFFIQLFVVFRVDLVNTNMSLCSRITFHGRFFSQSFFPCWTFLFKVGRLFIFLSFSMLDLYSNVFDYLIECMKIKRISYQLQTACSAIESDNCVKNRTQSSHTHTHFFHWQSQHWPWAASTLTSRLTTFCMNLVKVMYESQQHY